VLNSKDTETRKESVSGVFAEAELHERVLRAAVDGASNSEVEDADMQERQSVRRSVR
jgi:hypothetical protein